MSGKLEKDIENDHEDHFIKDQDRGWLKLLNHSFISESLFIISGILSISTYLFFLNCGT